MRARLKQMYTEYHNKNRVNYTCTFTTEICITQHIVGNYSCQCKDGFIGDGIICNGMYMHTLLLKV